MQSNTTEAEGGKKWDHVGERVQPKDLWDVEFYGYSVQVSGDLIAASADCNINVEMCRYDRDGVDADAVNVVLLQRLLIVNVSFGAVNSIAMVWDALAYSTSWTGFSSFACKTAAK